MTSGESFGSSGGGVGGGLPPIRPRQRRDVRGWLGGQRGARLVGVVFALAGIALLILGLVTLRGKPGGERPPGAAPTTSGSPTGRPGTPTPTATPTTRPSATRPPATPTRRTPPPPTTQPPARAPRFPLTVLNNTVQAGLAEAAAARFSAAGWPVALVGNFAGRIPSTTVYYAPGDTAQQRSAQTLASQFPGIHRVMQRYSGLPPTPPGLVVVITPDWTR